MKHLMASCRLLIKSGKHTTVSVLEHWLLFLIVNCILYAPKNHRLVAILLKTRLNNVNCAAQIVHCCQQYCSALLHLIQAQQYCSLNLFRNSESWAIFTRKSGNWIGLIGFKWVILIL